MEFIQNLIGNQMFLIFAIAILGYLVGRVSVCGLSLGTSGILLVALVFGHFGLVIDKSIQDLGLICFVTAVGLIAGPVFFENFKRKAFAYIIIGILVVLIGAALTCGAIAIFDTPVDVTMGIFTGALTSTPGLAAAKEITTDAAATGYAIAYPFGVIGVVLFVQMIPKMLKANIQEEAKKIAIIADESADKKEEKKATFKIDPAGFAPLALTIVLGMVLAKVVIPLPGGMSFSLGTSGGPLIMGLIIGHFRKVGKVSLEVPKSMLETLREFGLGLFLMGAGTAGGQGFVEVLKQHGVILFVIGVVITLVPMVCIYILARYVLKLEMFNCLGSICGGMTSTPALGSLISTAGTADVAASYAASYPIALLMVVLSTQVIAMIFM